MVKATDSWQPTNITVGDVPFIRVPNENSSIAYAVWNHYIGSIFDRSIIKSSDGGKTWQSIYNAQLPSSPGNDISALVVDKSGKYLYSGFFVKKQVYYSENYGENWLALPTLPSNVTSLAIDSDNPFIVYVGMYGSLYKIDRSSLPISLTQIATGLITNNVMYIDIASKNGSKLFLVGTDKALFKSSNGTTWQSVSEFSGSTPGVNGAIKIDPNEINRAYVSKGYNQGLWKTENSGLNWFQTTSPLNYANVTEIAINKSVNSILYLTTQSSGNLGIYKGTDFGNSWTNIKDNIYCNNNLGIDTNIDRIIVGTSGCGMYYQDFFVPTPTPIPTPTPPPPPHPVVFIPGFGGSWNREALMENKTVGQSEWSLTPFATEEYKAFIQTLKNAGLVEGTTLYSFYYDWRRPVTENGTKLKTFLDTITGTVNIVGHSMGGLVARACVDKVSGCKDKVNELITAGSPHFGAVDAYYLWNGVIPEKDQLKKTVEEILLKINNRGYSQPKDIVRNVIPSVKDLLPVFDYINGHGYSTMNSINKNPFLETQMVNTGLLTTISGNKSASTPEKLNVYLPNSIEYALGLWLDGRPFSKTLGTGDETVLKSSSKITDCETCDFNTYHGGLVGMENPQKKILEILDLPTTNAVSTFTPNNTWQSLWFILHSPATIKVYKNGLEVGKNLDSKTVYLENPSDGQYTVKVTGTGTGPYDLDIGAIGQDKTVWQTVSGIASAGSEHQYALNLINLDQNIKVGDLDGMSNLNMAKNKLATIGGFWPNYFIKAINGIQNNSGARVKIENLLGQIMTQIKTSTVASVRSDYADVVEYLINAYEIMAPKYGYVLTSTVVSKDLSRTQTLINTKNTYYSIVKPTTLAALNFTLANNYLTRSQTAFNLAQFYRTYLLSRSAFQIF